MKFKSLKKDEYRILFLVGFVCVVVLMVALVLNFTRAKYKYVDTMSLINGTVNYSLADLNIVAITVDGSNTSAFNSSGDRSEYVGLKYTEGSQHGTNTNSTIMGKLNTWYSTNIQNAGYSSYIDTNAGFCSDREMASGYSWSSQPSSTIRYAAYERLYTNKNPSFKCTNKNSDLFTVSSSNQGNKSLQYPVGLITADEVAYAGGVYGSSNNSYYLYTGQNYWTMSPYGFFGGLANVFRVHSSGYPSGHGVYYTYGVRPVINLKADTLFTGTGTSTDPYSVV